MIFLGEKRWPFRGWLFAHLTSDESMEELHAFAKRCGLKREWFQGDHYDLTGKCFARAVKLGAKQISDRECAKIVMKFRRANANVKKPEEERCSRNSVVR